MKGLFLLCALALPASQHTRPPIVSYHAMTDEEAADRIRKIHDFDEVYIHEKPQEDKLKESGFERYPALWGGKQIWIRRKPHFDKKMLEAA